MEKCGFLSCYWRVRWWSEVWRSQFPRLGALSNGTQKTGGAWQADFFFPLLCGVVFLSRVSWTYMPNKPCVLALAHCEVCQWGNPSCHNALHLSLLHFPFSLTLTTEIKHQHFNTCFRLCPLEYFLINMAVIVLIVRPCIGEQEVPELVHWLDIESLQIVVPFRSTEMSVTSKVTVFKKYRLFSHDMGIVFGVWVSFMTYLFR